MYTESGYNPKRRKSRHDLSSIYSKQCKIKAGINCELIESSNVAQCKTSKETIKNNKTTLNNVTQIRRKQLTLNQISWKNPK